VKNIGSLLHAMPRRRDVHVGVLSRSLVEPMAPKKTEERLHRDLKREGLGQRLL